MHDPQKIKTSSVASSWQAYAFIHAPFRVPVFADGDDVVTIWMVRIFRNPFLYPQIQRIFRIIHNRHHSDIYELDILIELNEVEFWCLW
jgi:hypothetical protein